MNKHHDVAVFIGRFQPFHNGHIDVIEQALEKADNVLVLVGSADAPRSPRNPWTYQERYRMITQSVDDLRVRVMPLQDASYNDAEWVASVQRAVEGWEHVERVALVGHSKDHTSYYLNMFPQWDSINVPNYKGINSTDIRAAYFSDYPHDYIVSRSCPPAVTRFLDDFHETQTYANLHHEVEFINKYKASWATAPYPPIFVTTDAVVVQSGHVLVVERKAMPGAGLLAMPGGFLGQNERIIDGTIRELVEETRIKVPEKVLRGSIVNTHVFDDPNRSTRGRTITHASLIKLQDGPLPKVRGGDDAAKAFWLPLNRLDIGRFNEDHYHVINYMIGRL